MTENETVRALSDAERLPLIEPGPPLSPQRMARFTRQLLLPGFGEQAQRRLQTARVLVVGAGGLGSAAIPYLASAGIGTIGVVDDDVVELSNLHRQTAHGMADIGRLKVDSIAETIHASDPETRVVRHPIRLTSSNIMPLLADYDLIVDGSDNFPTRYLTNDAATLARKPLVWGAILRYSGQAGVAWFENGPTYRDLFPEPPAPGDVVSCETGGVLPALCAAIGAIISNEVVKIIAGVGEPLLGRVTTFDALSGRYREIEYRTNPDAVPITELIDYDLFCGVKGSNDDVSHDVDKTDPNGADLNTNLNADLNIDASELNELLHAGAEMQLIDVREPVEASIVQLPDSELIPLGQLQASTDRIRSDVPVIIYCHHGPRSLYATRMLRALGHENVVNLAGGIDAYAAFDPTLARY